MIRWIGAIILLVAFAFVIFAFRQGKMILLAEFIGVGVAFVVNVWGQYRFESIWVKVLFFFIAIIAGNLVYLTLGIAWAMTNPATEHAVAHEVGSQAGQVLGATTGTAIFVLAVSLGRYRKARKRVRM
jgi:hypothetical protein